MFVYNIFQLTLLNSAFLFCRASDGSTDTESESESGSDSDDLDVPGKDQKRKDRSQNTG